MEDIKLKPLSSLIFFPLLSLIFIRPFISGLAYPVFEFYYEISIIIIAIVAIMPLIKLRKLPKAACEVKYGWILLLLSAYIISTITSVNIQNSIKETLKFISYVSLFLAVSQTGCSQKKILINTMVISASIISGYAIYQFFLGYPHTLDYIKKTNSDFLLTSSYAKDILLSKRVIGTFPSPNILGSYLVMIFFLSLTYIQPRRLRTAACAVIIVIALILTKSLGAWFSLILTLFILTAISYNQFEKQRWLIAISSIFIFFVLLFILLNRWERLINLENPQNSITQRLNYWRTAIGVIKDRPFLGVGPGNFQEVFLKYKIGLSTNTRYAHNIFLHQWAETGILGFLGIFYIIFNLLNEAPRASAKDGSASGGKARGFLERNTEPAISFCGGRMYKIQAQSFRAAEKFITLSLLAFTFHNLIDNAYFIPEAGMLWWVIIGLLF